MPRAGISTQCVHCAMPRSCAAKDTLFFWYMVTTTQDRRHVHPTARSATSRVPLWHRDMTGPSVPLLRASSGLVMRVGALRDLPITRGRFLVLIALHKF